MRRRRRRAPLIKSNNPHLAGGEQSGLFCHLLQTGDAMGIQLKIGWLNQPFNDSENRL